MKYIIYLLTAKNLKGHGIHSPFVFKLVTAVFNDKKKFGEFVIINKSRSFYYSSKETLQRDDFGAGSVFSKNSGITLRGLVRNVATKPKYGELLFRLVRFFQPKTILEFGTSFGLGTIYLAMAAPTAKVITIEGSRALADHAKGLFDSLGLLNIEIIHGEFGKLIKNDKLIEEKIDFAYFDGCHTKEMTISLFDKVSLHATESSIFVFDDIRWSEGMEEAWKYIVADQSVTISLDLFKVGIVFFKKEVAKQHIVLKF